MQKLLELLNQYDNEEGKDLYEWEIEGEDIIGYNQFWGGYETIDVSRSVIISKRYGFVERLVKKNKINKDLFSRVLIRAYVSPKTMVSLECEFYDFYESLLMMLSIQEDPVSFLIDLLK